jgi:hypothetical protein
VDASTLNVTVKGHKINFSYDSILNVVEIPSAVELSTDEVHIGLPAETLSNSQSDTRSGSDAPCDANLQWHSMRTLRVLKNSSWMIYLKY